MVRLSLSVLALALWGAPALAVPGDQPPLEEILSTPNFSYKMRTGISGSVHRFSGGKMHRAGDALDRTGASSLGNPLGYHAGYVNRGFREPWFSTPTKDVAFWACGDNPGGFDCDNGFATLDQIIMPTDVFENRSDSCIRGILGHELFHHIQFGYVNDGGGEGCSGGYGSAACEGHARALQDKIYLDLDLDPAASCIASFLGQVNGYLNAPDITIWKASYGSALFWTYLMEQYGTFAFEPGRGIDFLKNWWERARDQLSDPSIYDVTDYVIKQYQSDNATNAFHDFTIANTLKGRDLSQTSEAFRLRYSYRDEEPVPLNNNLMKFKEAASSGFLVVPSNGTPVSINVTAKRFGARYYNFSTESCPTGNTIEFSANPSLLIPLQANAQLILPDALHSLIAIEGNSGPGKPRKLYKSRSKSFKQLLVQPANHYNRLTAIISGWHTDYAGTLSARCLPPPPLPLVAQMSSSRPLVTGEPGSGSLATFGIEVMEPGGGGFDTLDLNDLKLVVDPAGIALLLPAVQKVREAAARMQVSVLAPNLAAGTYAAEVRAAGRSVPIPGGIRVGAHQPEVILALDTSASMGMPSTAPRLNSFKSVAQRLGHLLPSASRLGLMRFSGNGAGSNATMVTPLGALTAAQRAQWLADLAASNPGTATRIKLEDVLISSIAAFNAQGSNGERHLLIATDGGDQPALNVDALVAQARNAGIRLHLIALGGLADQPLLARLASQTGGSYDYIDVPAAGINRSEVLAALDSITSKLARRQTAAAGSASTGAGGAAILPVTLDNGFDTSATPHVKVFDGSTGATFNAVRLFRPDNSQVVNGTGGVEIFQNGQSFAFHVPNAPNGQWRLEVDPSVGGGPIAFDYAAAVVDPTRSLRVGFARPGGDNEAVEYFRVGEPVLIQAALTDFSSGPMPPSATASLTKAGAGTLTLGLRDDGSNGDQFAGDRIYSAIHRGTDSGSPSAFLDDESAAAVRGSTRVVVRLDFGSAAAPQIVEARGSFAVLREALVADADSDGMPDRFEVRQACLNPAVADATGDRDGDGALNSAEFAAGSNPCDPDSDDGGESDGSEIAAGRSPLDSGDDAIKRIRDLEILSRLPDHEEMDPLPAFAHSLRFDSDLGYATVLVKRAGSADGPFVDHAVIDAVAANGRYVDPGLPNGQTHCYQLIARTAAMVQAAGSDIVCATSRGDSTAPRGSIALNDGAPRSRSGNLQIAQLAIDHESPAGMQMRLSLPNGSDSGWIPYVPTLGIDVSSLQPPAVVTVAVVFRDAAGNESEQYVDDIELVSAASVGSISGQVRADTSLGNPDAPLAGVNVMPAMATESGILTDATGNFSLEDLSPGTHTLEFELSGYNTRFVANIVVSGGGNQAVGVVRLLPQVLLRDGFE